MTVSDDGGIDVVVCLDGGCGDLPGCTPVTCLPSQCGMIDNGCGGSIDCGPCSCDAMTCDALGARCGMIDDGCGQMANCGTCPGGAMCRANVCACAEDAVEQNDSREDPTALGMLSDWDENVIERLELNVDSATDADWFSAAVEDDSFDPRNPWIDVTVTTESETPLDVTVTYDCTDGTDLHDQCTHATPYMDSLGIGCHGMSGPRAIRLETRCGGDWSEAGTVYVRVQSTEAVCASYTLRIQAT